MTFTTDSKHAAVWLLYAGYPLLDVRPAEPYSQFVFEDPEQTADDSVNAFWGGSTVASALSLLHAEQEIRKRISKLKNRRTL